ncbi:hypothetical protein GCM10022281_00110 [Sphingomonas rosea]|uniref:Uncharacterized protein n=1 Tax=Sphingomonas rosea TaxID=335605 RepID=A0ABP7TFM3_9SPHN
MATAAAAVAARARRLIQHHFFAADAVRPDRAIPFEPGSRVERRTFERYRAAGAIHEALPGRYWLDLPAYDQFLQERFVRVRVALLFVIVALLVVTFIAARAVG